MLLLGGLPNWYKEKKCRSLMVCGFVIKQQVQRAEEGTFKLMDGASVLMLLQRIVIPQADGQHRG